MFVTPAMKEMVKYVILNLNVLRMTIVVITRSVTMVCVNVTQDSNGTSQTCKAFSNFNWLLM